MNLLVFNAGSSSLKFRLFEIGEDKTETLKAGGQVERIGKPDAQFTFTDYTAGNEPKAEKASIGAESVEDAATRILERLQKSPGKTHVEISAVGHRIVHGGAKFFQPTRIDDAVLSEIHKLTELAPLHNPAGIAGIEAARKALPHVAQVAVFDTAFHHALPAVAQTYAIPRELSERLQIRRYGFHGISYRYVSEAMKPLGFDAPGAKLILCHLGNGASVCATWGGNSVETSMGFTPLEGLIMGNRSGDVDPGLLLHLLRLEHLTLDELDDLLNHKSGMLGISGVSGDLRDLEKAEQNGDGAAKLALDCFAHQVRKYIGAYAATLGGVDALVFTGGIGEHSAEMRTRITQGLDFLGLAIDGLKNKNADGKTATAIGMSNSKRVWTVPTDEERQIAREAFALLHDRI